MDRRQRMGRAAGWMLRFGLAILLLAWLFRGGKVDFALLVGTLRGALSSPGRVAAAMAACLAALGVAQIRWYWLLRAHGFALPVGRVLLICGISQFFNAFMPGGCGGDLCRVYFAARETAMRRVEMVTTVMVDRGIGFLLQMGCGAVALAAGFGEASRLGDGSEPFVALCGGLAVAVAITVELFRRDLFDRWPRLGAVCARWRILALVQRLYKAIYFYKSTPRVLLGAAALSVANLLLQVLCCAAFGQAIGLAASFGDYLRAFPVISVLTSLPLTPGGFGVRESLYVLLFGMAGVPAHSALALSLLVYSGGLFWSLAGGVLFILFPGFRPPRGEERLRE